MPHPATSRSQAVSVSGAPNTGLLGVQRELLVRAMTELVAERGYAAVNVHLVTARAGVSRSAFYTCFDDLSVALLAVLDLGLQRTTVIVVEAFAQEDTWRAGLRSALVGVLRFLDSEPAFARVWLVESVAAGSWALAHWERNVAELREIALAGWPTPDAAPPLAAHGIMAGVLGVLRARLLEDPCARLIDLLGPLIGMVCAPYLTPAACDDEVARAELVVRELMASDVSSDVALPSGGLPLPAILRNPTADRARKCVCYLSRCPGASNRDVGQAIGVAHESQISRLLARLAAQGLVTKQSEGIGKRNVWRVTPCGRSAAELLVRHAVLSVRNG